MALLDTNPTKVRDETYEVPWYSWGVLTHKIQTSERIYEWPCDDTGGETTHEGTYATGYYYLAYSGRDIPRGQTDGVWREIYRTPEVWTKV